MKPETDYSISTNLDQEELIPPRPNSLNKNGAVTLFGTSYEGRNSEVQIETSIPDEMNDSALAELISDFHVPNKIDQGTEGVYSAKFVKAMESNHKKERENDKARIASLEQYIETIHAEFTKNK